MNSQPEISQKENMQADFLAPAVLSATSGELTKLSPTEYIEIAAEWFNLDVANGSASHDTICTYLTKLGSWFAWCYDNGVSPGSPTETDVKLYRKYFVDRKQDNGKGHSVDYITSLLNVVRRFYAGAVSRGYLARNPAAAVKPPRDRSAKSEQIVYLTAGEAELLFRSLPDPGKNLKALRDRVIIALMMLEGLRRVEIHRANIDDIQEIDTGFRMLIHGKGKDGYIYPREDVLALLFQFLERRGIVEKDELGDPLFPSLTKGGNPIGRITRAGISKLINTLYRNAAIKRNRLACHALRHTCGAQLYQATRDLKVVQETLRHATIAMAAKYSHILDRGKARYTQAIPIKPS